MKYVPAMAIPFTTFYLWFSWKPLIPIYTTNHYDESILCISHFERQMEYVLSYGNTFHKISLKLDRYNVEVVKYNAK